MPNVLFVGLVIILERNMNDLHKEIVYKVCLINPPILGVLEPWYDTPDFGRTGLAYLAGYLRQFEGFSISIIDAKFERLNFEQVRDRVNQLNPNLVGLTAFTNEIKPAAYQAALIKEMLPNTVTVIGGVHVTAIPVETLEEFNYFDVGVVGEGEVTFHELCHTLRHGLPIDNIPGLVLRQNNKTFTTPNRPRILDQDSIPLPAWDLLPAAETYFIQSMRGCPFSCLFCMNPNGKIGRKRSVESVIEELNWIINSYHPKHIHFGDELFSLDMGRTHRLLDAMIENKIGEKVGWTVQTHVHYVDDPLFQKFKQAKVSWVEMGIETGDELALKKMGKSTRVESIIKACAAGKKAGVKIGSFFLLGQPNETPKTLEKTVALAIKVNPDLPMFGLMTPYPGTEIAKMAANGEGGYRLLSTDWDEYNKQIGGALEFADLSRTQIEWFQVKAYLKVYLYNKRFWDLLKFVYEYRVGAWEVLKKIVFRNKSLVSKFNKPINYDTILANTRKINTSIFVTARDNWKNIQQDELRRANLQNAKAEKV